MADNTTLNAGSGGNSIRTDDIGGVHFPVSKIALGADGSDDGLVSSGTPMPCTVQGNISHNAADSGAPVKVGWVYTASPVAVDDGDRVDALGDAYGRLEVVIDSIAAGNNNIGNVDIVTLPALAAGTNNVGEIDVVGNVAHDAADSGDPVKIGGKASSSTPSAVADGDRVNAYFDTVGRLVTRADTGGDVAHDSADSGNPIKIGGKASSSTPTAVANGDRVDAYFDTTGHLHTKIDNTVAMALSTASLMDGTTALTPKFAAISAATAGTEIVALVSSKKIRVIALAITADAAGQFGFESDVTPTALSGDIEILADTPFVLNFNPLGWMETVAGEALELTAGTTATINGLIVYVEV